jgi:hypothetical protein
VDAQEPEDEAAERGRLTAYGSARFSTVVKTVADARRIRS